MKRRLLILFLLPLKLFATNYYVDFTGGLDVNAGTSSGTAWKTITKINGASFSNGDSILFKRGETWAGITIVPPRGDIHYGAYGIGANPIITGLITVSSWTKLGSNIYSATVNGSPVTVNMVLIGGYQVAMGRTPNYGYRTYTSFVNNTSITDPTLSGSPSWTGAGVVIRKNPFNTARATISNHTTTTLTFPSIAGNGFTANFGYFFENSLQCLDTTNEWFYDGAGTIKMYNTTTPPTIQVATLANLVSSLNSSGGGIKSNLSFENIDFIGCEQKAFNLNWCNNFKINNCTISHIAETGVYHKSSVAVTVSNTTLYDINTVGIKGFNGTVGGSSQFTNNTFKLIGWFPGMATQINATDYLQGDEFCAIIENDSALLISNNVIDSVGYCAVNLQSTKNNQVIKYNEIIHFCRNKNDGGGIYNSGTRGNGPGSRIYFMNNTIHDAFSASDGTSTPLDPHVRGIYLDATSDSVNVLNNTVFSCYGGIVLSSARGNIIRGNNILYGGNNVNPYFEGMIKTHYAGYPYQTTINNIITQNIVVSTVAKNVMYMNVDSAGNNVDIGGVIDSNYYVNASSIVTYPFVWNYGAGATQYTFSTWKAAHSVYDPHSSYLTPSLSDVRFEYNATGLNKVVNLGGYNYTDLSGVINYAGTITIAPYISVVLLNNLF